MTGRVAIVTGGNCGIGYEAARLLCHDGHDVVLACRSTDKGHEAAARIRFKQPNALISCMQLDLLDLKSVRTFAEEFIKKKRKLHMLINNAGILLSPRDGTRIETREGFEITMATNYLGHFLLTHLLLDMLKAAAAHTGDARIINLSSNLHDIDVKKPGVAARREIDAEDLMYDRESRYSPMQAYKDSSACRILMTYRLAKLLKHSGVSVLAVHPGFVPETNIMRRFGSCYRNFSIICFRWLCCCCGITRSSEEAGKRVAELASSDKYLGVTGKYFIDGSEARSSIESYDVDTQDQVWRATARLVGVDPDELNTVELQ